MCLFYFSLSGTVLAFHHYNKYLRFHTMISYLIVLDLWHGSTSWWECMVEQKCWYHEPGNRENKVEARGTYRFLIESMSPVNWGPPTSPYLLEVPPPPYSKTLGTEPSTHEALKDIQDPNCSRNYPWFFSCLFPNQFVIKILSRFPPCSKLLLSPRLYSDPLTCFSVTLLYILLQSFPNTVAWTIPSKIKPTISLWLLQWLLYHLV